MSRCGVCCGEALQLNIRLICRADVLLIVSSTSKTSRLMERRQTMFYLLDLNLMATLYLSRLEKACQKIRKSKLRYVDIASLNHRVELHSNAIQITLSTMEKCTALQWLTPAQTSNKKHPYMCM
jgi:hypothetical protein